MNPQATQPLFHLSPEALAQALELQRDFPRYHGLPLRLYIEGKGCDGFTYGVTFDARTAEDYAWEQGDLTCIIDPQTALYCKKSLIEWVDDERGTGFLVHNPNQRHFRGKFYKRKAWIERLEAQRPTSSPP